MATSKFCKFNTRFRQAADLVAETMGLEFISTPRQVENGTLCFYDPETDTRYSLHESGYVRRHIRTSDWMSDWKTYQLNRTKQVNVKYHVKSRNGRMTEQSYDCTQRILANPDEQLAIFVRRVLTYRN